jgi:hypothetical protein
MPDAGVGRTLLLDGTDEASEISGGCYRAGSEVRKLLEDSIARIDDIGNPASERLEGLNLGAKCLEESLDGG